MWFDGRKFINVKKATKDRPVCCYILLQSLCDWWKILGLVLCAFTDKGISAPEHKSPGGKGGEGSSDLCKKVPAPPPLHH